MTDIERIHFRKYLKLDPAIIAKSPTTEEWRSLHSTRSTVIASMKRLLDMAEKDERDLSDEENSAYTLAESIVTGINQEFERRDRNGNKEPTFPGLEIDHAYSADHRVTDNLGFGESRKWSDILYRSTKNNGAGFRDFESYLKFIAFGKSDGSIETRAMNTIIGESGGWIVPDAWAPTLINMVEEASVFLPRCRKFKADSKTINIPMWDSEDRTAGPLGAFAGSWQPEGSPADLVTPKVRCASVPIHKFSVYVDVSREAYQDGVGLAEQIGPALVAAVGYGIDNSCICGSGLGMPMGIMNGTSTIKYGRAAGSAIDFADVAGMYSRLWPAFVKDALWLANPSCLPQLLTIKDASGRYLWTPSENSIVNGIPGYLFGLPVFLTEKCANLGTEGDLILAAPSAFALAMREEISLEKSDAPQWASDLLSFRCIVRMGGQPLMDSAITPKTGGNNLSWAIVLQ